MKQWPHAIFSNVYGPTEVHQCTYYHVPAAESGIEDDFEDEKPIPIGNRCRKTRRGSSLTTSTNRSPGGKQGSY